MNLFNGLGFYQNRKAQERDAASIAAIVRLRSGRKVRAGKFHNCGIIFVTSNSFVAARSKDKLERLRVYGGNDVTAALTDRYLAGLLWVLYGGVAGELPSQVLLANCAAAVEPRADLIQRMHGFLMGVDEKQGDFFRALMTEERAAQYLSQFSLGDSQYVSQQNAVALLGSMKSALLERHEKEREEERAEFERAVKLQAEEFEVRHKEMESQLLQAKISAQQANEKVVEATANMQSFQRNMQEERLKVLERERRAIEWCVHRTLSFYRRLHFWVALFVAVLGLFGAFVSSHFEGMVLPLIGYLVSAAVFVLSFWKFPDWMFGRLMKRLREQFFIRKLESRGLCSDEASQFSIDWNTGDVADKLEV